MKPVGKFLLRMASGARFRRGRSETPMVWSLGSDLAILVIDRVWGVNGCSRCTVGRACTSSEGGVSNTTVEDFDDETPPPGEGNAWRNDIVPG